MLDGGAIVESLTLAPFPLLATDTLSGEYLPVDGSVGVRKVLSFAAGFVPILGDVKDVAEAAAGRDLITGELLKPWERWVSLGAALVPVVNGKLLGGGE